MKLSPFFAALFLSATTALAQPPAPGPPPPSVVTQGEGVIKRAPDRAWVTITAESRARTPGEAQKANATAMDAVMQKLKAGGIPPDAIKTASIDLQPEFDYANNRQTLRGYVARNALEVRVDTLTKLGEIIDTSVAAGATNVGGVRFDLKDRAGAEREALKLAVADARERANAAAAGAGLQVDRVLRIEESRGGVVPLRSAVAMAGMGAAQEARTPVAPGEIEIRATVILTAAVR